MTVTHVLPPSWVVSPRFILQLSGFQLGTCFWIRFPSFLPELLNHKHSRAQVFIYWCVRPHRRSRCTPLNEHRWFRKKDRRSGIRSPGSESFITPLLTSQPQLVILKRVQRCITMKVCPRSQMKFCLCRYFVNSRVAMQISVIILVDTPRFGPSLSLQTYTSSGSHWHS